MSFKAQSEDIISFIKTNYTYQQSKNYSYKNEEYFDYVPDSMNHPNAFEYGSDFGDYIINFNIYSKFISVIIEKYKDNRYIDTYELKLEKEQIHKVLESEESRFQYSTTDDQSTICIFIMDELFKACTNESLKEFYK